MRRVAHRRGRAATLAIGIIVASTGFSLLTASVSTGSAVVRRAVEDNFRPTYDILVLPASAAGQLRADSGLVRQSFLTGTSGGITTAQWHSILSLSGVAAAAPVENVGYILELGVEMYVPVASLMQGSAPQLYRLDFTWHADQGLASYPGGSGYLYYAPEARFVEGADGSPEQVGPDGRRLPICSSYVPPLNPGVDFQVGPPMLSCISGVSPGLSYPAVQPGEVVGIAMASFPMLVSAIDPVQEEKLLDMSGAMVAGRQLAEGWSLPPLAFDQSPKVPVIAATSIGLDERLTAAVQRLADPAGATIAAELADPKTVAGFLGGDHGKTVGTVAVDPNVTYLQQLEIALTGHLPIDVNGYWTATPPEVRAEGPAAAVAVTFQTPRRVWEVTADEVGNGTYLPPPGSQGPQWRHTFAHDAYMQTSSTDGLESFVSLDVVGLYDPARLERFAALAHAPLPFYPPVLRCGDSRSCAVLHGKPVGPTMSIGDYMAPPPALITTIQGAQVLLDSRRYTGGNRDAPLEAIMVRVAGVAGDDALSRARIAAVAADIHDTTGLAVVVTAGSSPTPVRISNAVAGAAARHVVLDENWVKVGVAILILDAVDRLSVILFGLVLVVCCLFVANAAMAEIRARQTELALLAAVGWRRWNIFRAALGEVALVGLLAGSAGALLAAALARSLKVSLPVLRAALVIPVGLGLAVLAGVIPAWRATRVEPLMMLQSGAARREPRLRVRRPAYLGIADVVRRPARVLPAVTGLAIGIAALVVVLCVERTFHGEVVGTVLGNVVDLRIRPAEVMSAMLAVLLGACAVADVLAVNLAERAAETAVLLAAGWRLRAVVQAAAAEGLLIGALGAVVGGGAGIAVSRLFPLPLGPVIASAALSAAAGLAVVILVLAVTLAVGMRRDPLEALRSEEQ